MVNAWYSDYYAEINGNYPGGNGSVIEGPVAAFLYDLLDGPNSPDSPTNTADGDDDAVTYPGSYMADIARTCTVNGQKANGIDHWIYCFERVIDPADVAYFVTRSPAPASFSEGATEPYDWSRDAIRTLWRRNLFGQ